MKTRRLEKRVDVKPTESCGTQREDYLNSLRANVKSYMKECGYTIDYLSEIADVSPSAFRDFLHGNTATVKLTPVIRLAKEFGISIDELIGADTLPTETKKSLQILRRLPEYFTYFYRWNIRTNEKELNRERKPKVVNLTRPVCANGGFIPSPTYETYDISHLSDDIRPRIFLAVKMPCEHYMPYYSPYHVLFIAHDRKPRQNEHCLVSSSRKLWLLSYRDGDFFSIRDGKFRCNEKDIDEIIGYVIGSELSAKE